MVDLRAAGDPGALSEPAARIRVVRVPLGRNTLEDYCREIQHRVFG
jgi:hypothetical protein